MERFGLNTAKSFIGKNVNLHLKDGSVIVNVLLKDIQNDELRKEKLIKCAPYGKKGTFNVPLRNIAWAELLNLNILKS